MLIGSPVHDASRPQRNGELRSIAGTYVTVTTPEGRVIRILRANVRGGWRPRTSYEKQRDPETLRLAEACGVSYQEARKVRGT